MYKHEIRISKSETNSKYECGNDQNGWLSRLGLVFSCVGGGLVLSFYY
jgi:hypothetical protein